MNALLKEAIAKAERLPDNEQAAIATIIIEEIKAEQEWDARMASTQQQLGDLARRARAEVAEEGLWTLIPPIAPSDRADDSVVLALL